MQKYVVVKFLEPMIEGDEFMATDYWPLHITLVANFTIPFDSTELYDMLARTFKKQPAISVVAGKDELFGANQDIRVTTIEMTPELIDLHSDIVDLLRSNSATFDEPRYVEDGYRAHATVQTKARLHEGDAVQIDELTIVDMFPDNDIQKRRVLKTIKLAGKVVD